MDTTHKLAYHEIDFSLNRLTKTLALASLSAFESFDVSSAYAYAKIDATKNDCFIFGITSKIHDKTIGYNVGFVTNLSENRLNTFWDEPTTSVLTPMAPAPVRSQISNPLLQVQVLEVETDFDPEQVDFMSKSDWTEDVCVAIEIDLEQLCRYWGVYEDFASYVKFDPEYHAHADCSNLKSIQFASIYDDYRTACFPRLEELGDK